MKTFAHSLLCVSGLALAGPLLAQNSVIDPPTVFKAGVGFDYSRGDYGFTQDTEVISTPLNLIADNTSGQFRVTLPWIGVKGPASVVSGATGAGVAAPGRPTRKYQSGFGDVLLSGTYRTNPVPGELNFDLTGRVKFGTADEAKGLGTGETDYYAQADVFRTFGKITPFGTAGYRFLGSNATYQLKDGAYVSGGSSFKVAEGAAVGASLDWRSKIVAGADDAFETTFFGAYNPNDRWNLVGYVIRGFTDGSPDMGVGGQATYKF